MTLPLGSGASRKALRIYESAGILPPSRRTLSGYRLYTAESLAVLSFLTQARRLGFTLKRIVAIRRQGRSACSHVRELVARKVQEMDQRLKELTEVRKSLRDLLDDWRPSKECHGTGCSGLLDLNAGVLLVGAASVAWASDSARLAGRLAEAAAAVASALHAWRRISVSAEKAA